MAARDEYDDNGGDDDDDGDYSSDYSDTGVQVGSHRRSQQAHQPAQAAVDPLAALAPPIYDVSFFLSAKGFTNVVLAPFFQGMFHGFGEGIARIVVGRWVGVDPVTALIARRREPPAAASASSSSNVRRPGLLSRLFGWGTLGPKVAPASATATATAPAQQTASAAGMDDGSDWMGVRASRSALYGSRHGRSAAAASTAPSHEE
ncbi:hypothetical protein BC831DRAFT_490602 [Entophlyctis helioformis]|nr:hypothetical protein BC831DRAFT_490602 [Entophlyctis helioformis]